jgi:hypothetical protein
MSRRIATLNCSSFTGQSLVSTNGKKEEEREKVL